MKHVQHTAQSYSVQVFEQHACNKFSLNALHVIFYLLKYNNTW